MSSIDCRAKLLLIVVVCVVAVVAAFGVTIAAGADEAYAARVDVTSSGQKIGVFEDVIIGPEETYENVVVVGGDVIVSGTVEKTIVVVFGDALIGSGARVGGGQNPDDNAVVVVFGDVITSDGAIVAGGIFHGVTAPGWVGGISISPDYRSWSWGSLAGWILLVIFLAVCAVVAAAIAPRQVAFVRERIRHHFFSSLGWGALLGIIAVPLISIVLIVTLVGIILLVPWLAVVVPIIWLFGFVSLGAMLGRLILRDQRDDRGPVILAAVLGVVILSVLWWIPVAGGIVLFLLGLVGFGATWVSMWDWRRRRKRERGQRVPGGGPPAPPVPPATYVPPAPNAPQWAGPQPGAPPPGAPPPGVPQPGADTTDAAASGQGQETTERQS